MMQNAAEMYAEDVITPLANWVGQGAPSALVTLVGIDGASPRPLGAQMAVRFDGNWVGYISGGCLEGAIAQEAAEVIGSRKPRLVRYGRGSPYFDIKLPCGSGLDFFIQPVTDADRLQQMAALLQHRKRFTLAIDLENGDWSLAKNAPPAAKKRDEHFSRVYIPTLRLLIIGSSPVAPALAQIADAATIPSILFAPDIETLPTLSPRIDIRPLDQSSRFPGDAWTSAIVAFHDHDRELPVFKHLLNSDCFAIMAIGSKKAHDARIAMLLEAGFDAETIARVNSPAGLIPGLRTAPQIAVSILAQAIDIARRDLL